MTIKEKIINVIVWIPLQLVACFIVIDIYNELEHHYMRLSPERICGTFFYDLFPLHTPYLILIHTFMVIGFALVLSYKLDEKKLWMLFVLLYAVYQIVGVGLLLLPHNTYLWLETISCSLYPAIVLLGLMIVMVVAKWINSIAKKRKKGDEYLQDDILPYFEMHEDDRERKEKAFELLKSEIHIGDNYSDIKTKLQTLYIMKKWGTDYNLPALRQGKDGLLFVYCSYYYLSYYGGIHSEVAFCRLNFNQDKFLVSIEEY